MTYPFAKSMFIKTTILYLCFYDFTSKQINVCFYKHIYDLISFIGIALFIFSLKNKHIAQECVCEISMVTFNYFDISGYLMKGNANIEFSLISDIPVFESKSD